MKTIKVLGTGCVNCKATLKLIEDTARAKRVEVRLEKVEAIADILSYGVMSTPGIVVDGQKWYTPAASRPGPRWRSG